MNEAMNIQAQIMKPDGTLYNITGVVGSNTTLGNNATWQQVIVALNPTKSDIMDSTN